MSEKMTMTLQKYEFGHRDQKIRKRWLITLPFMLVIELLTLWSHLSDAQEGWGTIVLFAAFSLVIYALLYFFGYRKHGIRFLLFYLLYPVLRIKDFASIAEIFKVSDVYEAMGLLLILGPYGWWYFASFRLIEVNKQVQDWKKQLKKQKAAAPAEN
ncbi:MAG: hypothetical protein JSS60_02780 [Verrucomicrobia bacterium]|nr:hypothetical protein [Verrucomicrobiota bacterium]